MYQAMVHVNPVDRKMLQETETECIKAGSKKSNILPILGDITKNVTQDQLIKETLKKFGKLDILVILQHISIILL